MIKRKTTDQDFQIYMLNCALAQRINVDELNIDEMFKKFQKFETHINFTKSARENGELLVSYIQK